jgi:hypothetical protein
MYGTAESRHATEAEAASTVAAILGAFPKGEASCKITVKGDNTGITFWEVSCEVKIVRK